MSFFAHWGRPGSGVKPARLQRRSNGRLASAHLQLMAGVLYMEVDRAFSRAQYYSYFPTSLADGCPAQARQFFCCKRFHRYTRYHRSVNLITIIKIMYQFYSFW